MKKIAKWCLIGIVLLLLVSFGLMLVYSTLVSGKQATTIALLERGLVVCLNGGTLYADDGTAIICSAAK